MREKQFDHIENKIKEAAANSEPDFDEQSWQKMELLLDKENDRRRPLAWFLIPVLLCAMLAGYFIFGKGNNNTSPKIAANANAPKENAPENYTLQQPAATENITEKNAGTVNGPVVNGNDVPVNGIAATAFNKSIASGKNATPLFKINPSFVDDAEGLSDLNNPVSSNKKTVTDKGKSVMKITGSDPSGDVADQLNTTTQTQNGKLKSVPVSIAVKNNDSSSVVKKEVTEKEKTKENTTAKTKEDKKKERKPSRFYFQVMAGAEVSSVKLLSAANSKTVVKYGLGVGYQLNDRLSVQTGLNVSKKRYIAGAGDYNPKAGSYWSLVEIKKVDANCLVYEIPLAVRYNVVQKKSINIYATAGMSSYIMKKEEYNYHYIKDNYYYEHNMSYKGNKNFFSVLSVSAGVEKKLNNGLSVQAEPSVSIPVSGVGDGKVKLYSIGLQVGLKYQPLKRKNNKD